MFKKYYSEKMDSISPAQEIKKEILCNLQSGEANRSKKIVKFNMRAVTAVAASIALIFSVVVLSHLENNPSMPKVKTIQKYVVTANGYDDIYSSIESILPKEPGILEKVFNFGKQSNAITDGIREESIEYNGNNAPKDGTAGASDHSETTTQVDGVDEADIVKTNGNYIFSLSYNSINVLKADGQNTKKVGSVAVNRDNYQYYDMYLHKDRLVLLGTAYNEVPYENTTIAMIYDISNPENLTLIETCKQSGEYNTSRMIGKNLYLVSNMYITGNAKKSNPETFIPSSGCEGDYGLTPAKDIILFEECTDTQYVVVSSFDVQTAEMLDTKSVLGGVNNVYCSSDNLITASTRYEYNENEKGPHSILTRFSIDDGKITLESTGKIDGELLNQFSIDQNGGYFRFVTTVNKFTKQPVRSGMNKIASSQTSSSGTDSSAVSPLDGMYSALFVLDQNLNITGKIENLAKGERVYSVRFMGETAFFVTFRNVDPLFSADLSDPHNPKIIGQLKIPGFSNYLFPYGDGKLLGIGMDADEKTGRTTDVKLSMFDISNPSDVREYNKTILPNANYSEALYNHKAILVDVKKNLIGFTVLGDKGDYYVIYSYSDYGFVQQASMKIDNGGYNTRGLYIGECFYVVSENSVQVYDMNGYNLIKTEKN